MLGGAGFNVEEYTQLQKQRLREIVAATERERQLLRERHDRAAAAAATRSTSPSRSQFGPADITAAAAPSTSPIRAGHGSTMTMSAFLSPVAERSAAKVRSMVDADEELLEQERERLRLRQEQLRSEEQALLVREAEIKAGEDAHQRRIRKAEERKRELLTALQRLQLRESELAQRERSIDEREQKVKSEADAARERQRELSHLEGTVTAEHSEREALLLLARKKAEERRADDAAVTQRLRTQLSDAEDRLRALEMQLTVKARSIEDSERELARQEARQRDQELRAIEQLRRDIDSRVVSFSSAANASSNTF